MRPDKLYLAEGAGLWPWLRGVPDAELFLNMARWNPISLHLRYPHRSLTYRSSFLHPFPVWSRPLRSSSRGNASVPSLHLSLELQPHPPSSPCAQDAAHEAPSEVAEHELPLEEMPRSLRGCTRVNRHHRTHLRRRNRQVVQS